jgi:hypothetical protein
MAIIYGRAESEPDKGYTLYFKIPKKEHKE